MSVTLEVPEKEPIPGLLPDGKPDPAYAAALGMVPASPARRSAAFAIDAAIFALLLLPTLLGALPTLTTLVLAALEGRAADVVHAASDPGVVSALLFYAISQGLITVYVLVQLILHGVKGITIGKSMLGLRSVNARTFAKPGFWRVLLRALVLNAATVFVPLLGVLPFLLSPLWDSQKRGRGWQDHIGGNWIIDRKRGLDPFDAKALRHARRRLESPPQAEEQRMPSLSSRAGAQPSFVPAARSSSGVVSGATTESSVATWEPPVVGAPPPGTPKSPPRAPRTSATPAMVFDDGLRYEVRGTGLLGRNPQPPAGETALHVLALTDETFQISKTHASFGLDDGRLWVMDRASANGTLVRSGGRSIELAPWQQHPLQHGDVVELGGRSFRVENDTEGAGA